MSKRFFITALCLIMVTMMFAGCQNTTASESAATGTASGSDSAYVGKITAIDGDQITIALGTLSQGEKPDKQENGQSGDGTEPDVSAQPDNSAQAPPSNDGSAKDGESDNQPDGSKQGGGPGNGSDQQPPFGSDSSGNNPGTQPSGGIPSGGIPSGGIPSGEMPSGGGPGGSFTASGEEMTITVSDATEIKLAAAGESETGAISDLAVGNIITVTMSGDTAATITVEQTEMGGGPGGQDSKPADSAAPDNSPETTAGEAATASSDT